MKTYTTTYGSWDDVTTLTTREVWAAVFGEESPAYVVSSLTYDQISHAISEAISQGIGLPEIEIREAVSDLLSEVL